MSTTLNVLINNRVFTTFSPLEKELALQPDKNYLFDLSYLGVLEVIGPNAFEFLQGQLTCNTQLISDSKMIQGAQCNLKGRILALMDVLHWHGVKLVLPQDLLEVTQASLSKTALLSKVLLKPNTQLSIFGFYLQNPEDNIPGNKPLSNTQYAQTSNDYCCCYHLGNRFYMLLVQSDYAHEISASFKETQQLLGSLTWHTVRLKQKQIDIYPESRGLFLPHKLNLHQTPYLSFNKGCYKGQEIIARMHYKAILKHQLKIYQIKTRENIHSGQKLYDASQKMELGELIDFSQVSLDEYIVALSIVTDPEPHLVWFERHENSVQLKQVQ